MFSSETNIVVRYAETDQMGIVHHSNYPIWYEVARTEFIKKLGMSYSGLEKNSILLPLIELKCKYKGAAKFEDELKIQTRIKELTPVKIAFCYEIYKNFQTDTINYGETVHVFTNKELKPINIRKNALDVYNLLSKTIDIE